MSLKTVVVATGTSCFIFVMLSKGTEEDMQVVGVRCRGKDEMEIEDPLW